MKWYAFAMYFRYPLGIVFLLYLMAKTTNAISRYSSPPDFSKPSLYYVLLIFCLCGVVGSLWGIYSLAKFKSYTFPLLMVVIWGSVVYGLLTTLVTGQVIVMTGVVVAETFYFYKRRHLFQLEPAAEFDPEQEQVYFMDDDNPMS